MAGQSKKQAATERRARIAEMQAAERARERRNKILLGAGAVVVAAGAVVGIVAAVDSSQHGSSSATGTSSVNWAVPANADAAVKAAGLTMLTAEGTAEHIHAHVDIWVNGQKIAVPQLIGINESAQTLSPLHTHDNTGVVHIESPVVKDYKLGQFMTEWGVPLNANQIGGDRTDATHTLKVYVNGKPTSGDPSQLVFHAHDEIAIVYGTAGQDASVQIPSSYSWPSGL